MAGKVNCWLLCLALFYAAKGSWSLECHKCGKLSEDPRQIQDCLDEEPPESCGPGEFCVAYVRNYKLGSEAVKGCYPLNGTLPGVLGALVPAARCDLSSETSSPVKFCMCNTNLCNSHGSSNSAHSVRPRQLFAQSSGGGQPACPRLEVSGADYADCNGEYELSGERVEWAPQRFVYKHLTKDRYMFWNAGGLGWSIGKLEYLSSGSHWHRSGLDTREPWEGRWEGGVRVDCGGKSTRSDCLWSGFSEWGRCSATCGAGQQERRRKVLQPAAGGGKECFGDELEIRSCNGPPCPRSCDWGPYGPWSACSKTCGGGSRTRTRQVVRRAEAGGSCEGEAQEAQFCSTESCPDNVTDACCNKVSVGSTGNARIDQALYMGIYSRAEAEYNGRAVYRREGRNPLFIYYFTSERDRLSLWVIGPQLGQFIAGIRNSNPGNCVHDLGSGWKYASRAGVWEDNDPSLSVNCYNDPGQATRERVTTTLPPPPTFPAEEEIIDEVFEGDSTTFPSLKKKDCEWTDYGPWSECSRSCDRGTQVRTRGVLTPAAGGGAACKGGNRERRVCNETPCSALVARTPTATTLTEVISSTTTTTTTTTSTTTSTTTTTTTTTTTRAAAVVTTTSLDTRERNTRIDNTTPPPPPPPPRAPGGRVRCYICGSLFSTDAPDCPVFNKSDPKQQKTCEIGEACLYYSWQKSDTDTAVIRECFPTSILLGSIDDPVEPTEQCSPVPVESDTIKACICTTDLCTGIGADASDNPAPTIRSTTTTTTPQPFRRPTTTIRALSNAAAPAPQTAAPARPSAAPARSVPGRVRCHQCGSLFSTTGNPDCQQFNEDDPLQQNLCGAGEACLWYSWQKSAGETSIIRECFSKSILLGSIEDPLLPEPTCRPKDISESSLSRITACLCESDLCNSYRAADEKRPDLLPVRKLPQTNPLPLDSQGGSKLVEVPQQQSSAAAATDLLETPRKVNEPASGSNRRVETATANSFRQQETAQRPKQTFHEDKPGLQCYSCGSLLNPNKKCDVFSREDRNQVQTCLKDEACLMYSWKKSASEVATLRECFPTRVLLGSIEDPLVPLPDCSQRDITDDGSGSIFACLCRTDFCNDAESSPFQEGNSIDRISSSQLAATQRPTNSPPPPPTTRPPSPPPTTRAPPPPPVAPPTTTSTFRPPPPPFPERQASRTSCPAPFQLAGGSCFFLSDDRVAWIEARKMCEIKKARLVSIETEAKRGDLVRLIVSSSRRRRSEFWLSGNDIDEEGVWEWARIRTTVPEFGWTEEPFDSPEENCLAWTITAERRGSSDGWHPSSCCNNLQYICEL